MDVASIMSESVVTAAPHDTVRKAMALLESLDVRHLPIVEDGRVVGLISDRDLREYSLPLAAEQDSTAEDLLDTPLSQVMTEQVLSVDANEDLRTAVDLMLEYRVGALPVLDAEGGALVGMLSYVDILRCMRDEL